MNRQRTWWSLLSVAGLLLTLNGCNSDAESHAATAAQEALGVTESNAKTKPTRVLYEVVERVIDPETDKVLSEKKTVTPVTIQTEIKKDVKAEVGETRAEAG